MNGKLVRFLRVAIGLALLLYVFISGYSHDHQKVFVVAYLLLFAIVDLIFFRKNMRSQNLVKVTSYDWIFIILFIPMSILWLASDQINGWITLAMVIVVLVAAINLYTSINVVYRIDSEGIWDLSKNKKILKASMITNVKYLENEISIDTTRYINHFEIKHSRLKSPSWEELIERIKDIEKQTLLPAKEE
ncbi:hypothetical protein [Fulvivirga ligni]|uniref:hypothetical protein n=1 Tax=Fulvivirga ligni TaxID=2904246 RepID=UPI001F41BF88|nr:hypothetical protein [Fulvivirga ligni]UII24250.1 hypothetical protein LVD16_13595 [Fulvivirga ligni]